MQLCKFDTTSVSAKAFPRESYRPTQRGPQCVHPEAPCTQLQDKSQTRTIKLAPCMKDHIEIVLKTSSEKRWTSNRTKSVTDLAQQKHPDAHNTWNYVQTWKLSNNASSNNLMPFFFFISGRQVFKRTITSYWAQTQTKAPRTQLAGSSWSCEVFQEDGQLGGLEYQP